LGDLEWHDLNNPDSSADLKHVRSNYIDTPWLDHFNFKAPKNVHELDPTSIPKALNKWLLHILILYDVHHSVLKISHDNIGDLYMRKNIRLLANIIYTQFQFIPEEELSQSKHSFKHTRTG